MDAYLGYGPTIRLKTIDYLDLIDDIPALGFALLD
jgi:hypothetical protein